LGLFWRLLTIQAGNTGLERRHSIYNQMSE